MTDRERMPGMSNGDTGYTDLPYWQRGNARQRADIEAMWGQLADPRTPLFVRQFLASMAPLTEAIRRDMESLPARLNAVFGGLDHPGKNPPGS